MQLSASPPRKLPPAFVNHTPRVHETITLVPPEETPAETMPPLPGFKFSAGPMYTNSIMGQTHSALTREQAAASATASSKPDWNILREDSVNVEECEAPENPSSRPDSWSMHYDCTDQAPYAMNTPETILRLPKSNPSHDLCFFLRSTGPTASHRRPSTLPAAEPSSKDKFRFRKLRHDAQVKAAKIREAVGLPPELVPSSVEQKASSSGKKYLALKVESDPHAEPQTLSWTEPQVDAPALSPSIVESRVSISFADSINSVDQKDTVTRPSTDNGGRPSTDLQNIVHPAERDYGKLFDDAANDPDLPVRPRASNPPTPEPASAVSVADSYRSDLTEHPAKRSFDISRALTSHPVHTTTSLPLPKIQLAQGSGQERAVEIEHPCPRRYASHNVLLQRASSLGTSIDRRSFTDSPGPPPPRSPLRPRSDARTIEGILASYQDREVAPKAAPSIMDPKDYMSRVENLTITPTVITECSGPLKRPKSRGISIPSPYQSLRRQREERSRARKLRDRPTANVPISIIDAIIHAPPPVMRQKLRKTRPRIQIPPVNPSPLARRASSSASSNASWRNITDPAPLVSAAGSTTASPDTSASPAEKTGYTPISPTTSDGSTSAETRMALSPVMLVAEEVPLPKSKPPLKPARMVVREGKSYNPRPRSASIPRSAMKRRSRQGAQTPSRPNSPAPPAVDEKPPPLPSPPPNRALPPTPPASGSEKATKVRSAHFVETKKELPSLPVQEPAHKIAMPHRRPGQMPHVASMRKGAPSKDLPNDPPNVNAILSRLEDVEKSNALLSAALTAVLRTNGALNAPLSELANGLVVAPPPMSWESRVTRRSAAGHTTSTSNGSALDMYMNTRHGSNNYYR